MVLTLRAAPGAGADSYVHLRRLDASEGVTVRVRPGRCDGGPRASPPNRSTSASRSLAERHWRLWLAVAAADDPQDASAVVDGLVTVASSTERGSPRSLRINGRHVGPLDVDPEAGAGRARLHGRLLQVA